MKETFDMIEIHLVSGNPKIKMYHELFDGCLMVRKADLNDAFREARYKYKKFNRTYEVLIKST